MYFVKYYILENTTQFWMIEYIIGKIFSFGDVNLFMNIIKQYSNCNLMIFFQIPLNYYGELQKYVFSNENMGAGIWTGIIFCVVGIISIVSSYKPSFCQ